MLLRYLPGYKSINTLNQILNTALGKMTLLPLVKVNSPGQSQPTVDLTRRVGPPTRRVPILTSQPYSLLLVEYGINSTSSLLNQNLGNLHPTRRVI